jgi:hypothetical protein
MCVVISLRSIPSPSRPDLTLIVHLSASGAACFPHPATIAGDPTHP